MWRSSKINFQTAVLNFWRTFVCFAVLLFYILLITSSEWSRLCFYHRLSVCPSVRLLKTVSAFWRCFVEVWRGTKHSWLDFVVNQMPRRVVWVINCYIQSMSLITAVFRSSRCTSITKVKQEAQLPLRNRASAMYSFVVKLLSLAVSLRLITSEAYVRWYSSFVMHTANTLQRATAAREHNARPHCRLKSPF